MDIKKYFFLPLVLLSFLLFPKVLLAISGLGGIAFPPFRYAENDFFIDAIERGKEERRDRYKHFEEKVPEGFVLLDDYYGERFRKTKKRIKKARNTLAKESGYEVSEEKRFVKMRDDLSCENADLADNVKKKSFSKEASRLDDVDSIVGSKPTGEATLTNGVAKAPKGDKNKGSESGSDSSSDSNEESTSASSSSPQNSQLAGVSSALSDGEAVARIRERLARMKAENERGLSDSSSASPAVLTSLSLAAADSALPSEREDSGVRKVDVKGNLVLGVGLAGLLDGDEKLDLTIDQVVFCGKKGVLEVENLRSLLQQDRVVVLEMHLQVQKTKEQVLPMLLEVLPGNKELKKLDLSQCMINDNDAARLAAILQQTNISSLNLSNNVITNAGVREFEQMLSGDEPLFLEDLNLDGSDIGGSCIQALLHLNSSKNILSRYFPYIEKCAKEYKEVLGVVGSLVKRGLRSKDFAGADECMQMQLRRGLITVLVPRLLSNFYAIIRDGASAADAPSEALFFDDVIKDLEEAKDEFWRITKDVSYPRANKIELARQMFFIHWLLAKSFPVSERPILSENTLTEDASARAGGPAGFSGTDSFLEETAVDRRQKEKWAAEKQAFVFLIYMCGLILAESDEGCFSRELEKGKAMLKEFFIDKAEVMGEASVEEVCLNLLVNSLSHFGPLVLKVDESFFAVIRAVFWLLGGKELVEEVILGKSEGVAGEAEGLLDGSVSEEDLLKKFVLSSSLLNARDWFDFKSVLSLYLYPRSGGDSEETSFAKELRAIRDLVDVIDKSIFVSLDGDRIYEWGGQEAGGGAAEEGEGEGAAGETAGAEVELDTPIGGTDEQDGSLGVIGLIKKTLFK